MGGCSAGAVYLARARGTSQSFLGPRTTGACTPAALEPRTNASPLASARMSPAHCTRMSLARARTPAHGTGVGGTCGASALPRMGWQWEPIGKTSAHGWHPQPITVTRETRNPHYTYRTTCTPHARTLHTLSGTLLTLRATSTSSSRPRRCSQSGAHELHLSATSKLVFSALFLSLHLRPRDRLNGGIHPRHPQMAPTSLSLK